MDIDARDAWTTGSRPALIPRVALRASDLVRALPGLALEGDEVEARAFAALTAPEIAAGGAVTFFGDAAYARHLAACRGLVVVTTRALLPLVPPGHACVVGDAAPRDTFYALFAACVRDGWYPRLRAHRAASARVAPSATILDNVHVDEDVTIDPGVVVYPNTYLGPGVRVKANAVLGGDGFEVATIAGERRVVPHAGGVWLEAAVEVGSQTCVDRGLYGTFTYAGRGTKFDNLVHVGHNCDLGVGCTVTACSEIGAAVLHDGVWLGPNVSVASQLVLGEACFVGAAANVVRSLPAFSLAYGSPAKVHAYVCRCRTKLTFQDETAACARCGRRYAMASGVVRER